MQSIHQPTPVSADETTVHAADFGVRADGTDTATAVRAALAHCRNVGARRLVFSAGRYTFRPDFAVEEYLFMSNNDSGLRRVAFHVQGFTDFEIDGGGAEFIFHGLIVPFVVAHSTRVQIKNVTVDWATPFHCEGQIVSSNAGGMELTIPEAFPYRVVNGRFQSLGPNAEGWTMHHLLEFDPVRGATARDAEDYHGADDRFVAVELSPGRVRLDGPLDHPWPRPGNVLLLSDGRRMCPAFLVTDTDGFTLSDASIFHAGAMGLIAQRSADLRVLRLQVMPRPGGGRVISTIADATHFVSCRGRVELNDCVFRTQVDDATNVHGLYARIARLPTARQVTVQLVHPQQAGTHVIEAGHRVRFVNHETLAPIHEATVQSAQRLNAHHATLDFADDLPAGIREHDVVFDLFWQPTETILRGCTIHGNRARGFLISVGGRVLVEGCKFHTPGAAILLEGDANYWFEAGPVQDVTIRDSDFSNCNYGPWGRAAIQISPGVAPTFHGEPRFHRNVRIEGNRFEVFFPTLLDARDTDGLLFCGNQVTPSQTQPPKHPTAPPFVVEHCSGVQIEPCDEREGATRTVG